jgi:hypothetical protein
MCFSAAELRGHVEHGGRFSPFPGKAADNLSRQTLKVLGQERAIKETLRPLVVLMRPAIPDLIEVNGKLGSIQWLAFP